MKEITSFYFGNYPSSTEAYFLSSDYGIINAIVDGGLFEENFIPEKEIRETYIRGNDKPLFHGIDLKPLEFSLTFAFEESFDESYRKNGKLRELASWLIKPYYIPFGLVGDEKIYYVTCINKSDLLHNGLSQGYIKLDFRCDAPWAYGRIKTLNYYGLSPSVGNESVITFNNEGDLDILPEIWISKNNTGEFKIVNETTGDKEFKFQELLANETVYIHNEKEYIESDREPTMYRYDGFSNSYLRLITGKNTLRVYGACDIRIRYQEKFVTM